MSITEKLSDVISEWVLKAKLFQGVVCHLKECFSGPGHEVYNSGIVDETGVHPTIVSKVISSFAHEEDDVEVVLDPRVELTHKHFILDVLVLALLSLISQHSCHYLFHLLLDGWYVFFSEQVRDLSNSQNGVDILHKRFLSDLVVREHKDWSSIILESAFLRPFFDLLPELF